MGEECLQSAELLKALAHPIRLNIVRSLLQFGCRNVNCMVNSSGYSQSCISQHLAKLKAAGVVTAERIGNEVYYELSDERVARIVSALFSQSSGTMTEVLSGQIVKKSKDYQKGSYCYGIDSF